MSLTAKRVVIGTPVIEICESFAPDAAHRGDTFLPREDGTLVVRGRRDDYAIRATNAPGEFELLGRGRCCLVNRVQAIVFDDEMVLV